MPRQKKVFPTNEVAHIWAQQSQEEGINPQGNFYFKNESIYSYGSHYEIARFHKHKGETVVLLNNKGYSPTTNGHICNVRSAVSHLRVISSSYGIGTGWGSGQDNLRRYTNDIKCELRSLAKARKPQIYISNIKGIIAELQQWQELFPKSYRVKKKDFPLLYDIIKKGDDYFDTDTVAHLKATEKKEEQARKRKAKEQAKRDAEQLRVNIEEFKTFEKNNVWNSGNTAYLRVNNTHVQTSKGLSFTHDECLMFYAMWKTNPSELVGNTIFDRYRVTQADDKGFTAGCHTISADEMKYAYDKIQELKS